MTALTARRLVELIKEREINPDVILVVDEDGLTVPLEEDDFAFESLWFDEKEGKFDTNQTMDYYTGPYDVLRLK